MYFEVFGTDFRTSDQGLKMCEENKGELPQRRRNQSEFILVWAKFQNRTFKGSDVSDQIDPQRSDHTSFFLCE